MLYLSLIYVTSPRRLNDMSSSHGHPLSSPTVTHVSSISEIASTSNSSLSELIGKAEISMLLRESFLHNVTRSARAESRSLIVS